jgi:hypothetical protein
LKIKQSSGSEENVEAPPSKSSKECPFQITTEFPNKHFYFLVIHNIFFKSKDEVTREHQMARIDMIRKRYNLSVHYETVTREDKDMIVKAMDMAKGHWFKCPKGELKVYQWPCNTPSEIHQNEKLILRLERLCLNR